jgi:hypothetical protein
MAERDFSPESLETVGAMARRGANIVAIRSALHKTTGIWYRDFEIVAAAKMFGLEQASQGAGPPVVIAVPVSPRIAPQSTETVHIVPPGSFPANRFSMLRGRLR